MIDSPMECRVQGSAVCHPGNNLELQSLGMLPDQLSQRPWNRKSQYQIKRLNHRV
jgi:hypothetical protein